MPAGLLPAPKGGPRGTAAGVGETGSFRKFTTGVATLSPVEPHPARSSVVAGGGAVILTGRAPQMLGVIGHE